MWDQLTPAEKGGAVIMLVSAIVDIIQFSWMLRSWIKSARRAFYNRVAKEVLLDQHHRNRHRPDRTEEKPEYFPRPPEK